MDHLSMLSFTGVTNF